MLSPSNTYIRTIAIYTRFKWNSVNKRSWFKAHFSIAHENGHFETIECPSVMCSLRFFFSLVEPHYILYHMYIISSSQSLTPCLFVFVVLLFLFSSHSYISLFARIKNIYIYIYNDICLLLTVQSEHVQSNKIISFYVR